jgi:hypothetical protein
VHLERDAVVRRRLNPPDAVRPEYVLGGRGSIGAHAVHAVVADAEDELPVTGPCRKRAAVERQPPARPVGQLHDPDVRVHIYFGSNQSVDAFDFLNGQLDVQLTRLQLLFTEDLSRLNERLRSLGLDPVTVPPLTGSRVTF